MKSHQKPASVPLYALSNPLAARSLNFDLISISAPSVVFFTFGNEMVNFNFSCPANLLEKKLPTVQLWRSWTSSQTTHGTQRQFWLSQLSLWNTENSGTSLSFNNPTTLPNLWLFWNECLFFSNLLIYKKEGKPSLSSVALSKPLCKSSRSSSSSRNSLPMIQKMFLVWLLLWIIYLLTFSGLSLPLWPVPLRSLFSLVKSMFFSF